MNLARIGNFAKQSGEKAKTPFLHKTLKSTKNVFLELELSSFLENLSVNDA